MLLDNFYTKHDEKVSFSKSQASRFAKEVAEDFNPIHNEDAKIFCVPGDLLFSVILAKRGLSRHMRFTFAGMVGEGINLGIEESSDSNLALTDGEKNYLEVEHSGEVTTDAKLIQDLTCGYVTFSGHSFPDVLVTLMAENDIMINPSRPLVMYESMVIDLDHLDIDSPTLELSGTDFSVKGKKGVASLKFCIKSGGETVGRGEKLMTLRGLRPYDSDLIDQIVTQYNKDKSDYLSKK